MAKILKKSELARCLEMQNASVTMGVKNNLLIQNKDGKIDIDFPINKAWIQDQINKGRTFDLNRALSKEKPKPKFNKKGAPATVIPKDPEPKCDNYQSEKIIPEYPETDYNDFFDEVDSNYSNQDTNEYAARKIKADALKAEAEAKLKALQIQKMEGQLVPVDAVQSIIIFAVESFRTAYLQGVNGVADIFSARTGISHDKYIELKKDLTEKIDMIHKDGRDIALEGLEGVVKEYQEVRGRGEKR